MKNSNPTIQGATEGAINNFTAYLRGDVEELDPHIPLAELDPDLMADRIVDGIMALTGELFAGNVSNQPAELGQVDMDELADFGQGNIVPLPTGISSATLANLSPEQQDALRQALLGEAAAAASPTIVQQLELCRDIDLPRRVLQKGPHGIPRFGIAA